MTWLRELIQDWRHAARNLIKAPGFSVAVVLTLTLGTGMSTAIFTAVNPMLFRPLPFKDFSEIVYLNESNLKAGFEQLGISYADYLDWRKGNHVFSDVGLFTGTSETLGGGDAPERVDGCRATASFLAVLGAEPMLGRSFAAEDERPSAPATVILSHRLWEGRFSSDRDIVGKSIDLSGKPATVIGVTGPNFRFPDNAEFWTPIVVADPAKTRGGHSYSGIARLKPGATMEDARRDMEAIHAGLAREYPDSNLNVGPVLRTLREQFIDGAIVAWIVLAAAGLLLGVSCANAAGLFLARSLGRRKEFAIRAALGAGRWRTMRQLLAEGLMLAAVAGGLGLAFAPLGVKLLLAAIPDQPPSYLDFGIDGRVIGFAIGAAFLTCLLFSLAPAWSATAGDPHEDLKASGRGAGESKGRNRLRGLLIAGEIAVSMLLLTGTGLMTRTVMNLMNVDPGFNPGHLAVFDVELPAARYGPHDSRTAFRTAYLERLRALPGVESAAAATNIAFSGSSNGMGFLIEGEARPADGQAPIGNLHRVTPDYFAAMRIPLLAGRDFTAADREGSANVAIIDAKLAERYFAGTNPIGRRMTFGDGGRPMEIVGVAGNVKHFGLDTDERPAFYIPLAQDPWTGVSFVVRTAGANPLAIMPAARAALREIDPSLPVSHPNAMAEMVRRSFWQRAIVGQIFGVFSLIATALAAAGIAGAMAYMVAQRRQEIGVRMALGAQACDVQRLVIERGMRLAAVGLAAGAAASLALGRLLSVLLFGVAGADPLTLGGSLLIFAAVALAACWLPARRAARMDPMTALRSE